jgi:hypothetical protein
MKEEHVSWYKKGVYFGELQYFPDSGPVTAYQTREVKRMTACSVFQNKN